MRGFLTIVIVGAFALFASPAYARRHPAPSPTPTATIVPTPPAPPVSQAARVAKMRGQLDEIARTAPGRLGVAVVDLATDDRFAIRGDEAFGLASVAKLPIAIAAYRLADQKKLALDDRVVVTRGDLRRGASEIAREHPAGGASLPYWQLIRGMLVTSDNTASDVVLRAIGGPSVVQRTLERLHVRGLTIRKSEAELAADARAGLTAARGGDNLGTPNAIADLLVGLATQRYTLLDSTYELLSALESVSTGAARLHASVVSPLRLAHKTGTSDTISRTTDATNDAGLITLPDGRRIAVVAFLAGSDADDATRDATLARVAQAVVQAYAP